MELTNGIDIYCPHCDEPFTMYPFGQQVIDTTELDALRQRAEAAEARVVELERLVGRYEDFLGKPNPADNDRKITIWASDIYEIQNG